ncbi:hypothetical protein [Alkalicoccus halolimnae]|uniref:Uncharacterized protein n=1 Tax=Alkalicoccus halolimnae TaxID=1667239 RepID=A0A5C7FPA2_9BACI|nr:hypothetical protein [Alkalicoccus halolimnae]TXF87196.1 hypothetical protein FTX54_00280 [Alkalicoccus halolimnae]
MAEKSLNEQITEVIEKTRLKKKWSEHQERLAEALINNKITAENLKMELDNHNLQYKDLLNIPIVKLISSTAEENHDQLSHSQLKSIEWKLLYQEALRNMEELERERVMYEEHAMQLKDVKTAGKLLEDKKNEMILNESSLWSDDLYNTTVQEINIMGELQELYDAVDAGEHAYYSLEDTRKALDKASNWSVFDMLSGGIVTAYMQQSQLDDAKESLHRTARRLRQFQDELIDIEQHQTGDMNIGTLLSNIENFYGDIIVYWIVKDQINDAVKKVSAVQSSVSELVNELKERSSQLESRREEVSLKRIRLIGEA